MGDGREPQEADVEPEPPERELIAVIRPPKPIAAMRDDELRHFTDHVRNCFRACLVNGH